MDRYRTKPVEVDAFEWAGPDAAPEWFPTPSLDWRLMTASEQALTPVPDGVVWSDGPGVILGTRAGAKRPQLGDWIIRHADATLDVMYSAEFAAIYEIVPPEPDPE